MKFWISSCLESFLRGTYPILQLLLVRSGVIKKIVRDIITKNTQDETGLQTSFDLLSEIIKYNKRTLLIFESSISEEEFNIICTHMLQNIIDSNVFIRALILSLYRFEAVNFAKYTNRMIRSFV